MEYVRHGGHCCGYAHIYGFDHATIATFDAAIATHFDGTRGEGRNRILEAILTDRQLIPTDADRRVPQEVRDAGGWPVLLASRGFRLAAQWQNSNTGRHCYQFLKIETLLTDQEGYTPRFDWAGAVLAAAQAHPVAPPPPPVQVRPEDLPSRYPEGTIRAAAPRPTRLDPNLPVQVRDGRTGRVYDGEVTASTDVYVSIRVTSPDAPRSVFGSWNYLPANGYWAGDGTRAWAFNVREPEEVPVVVENEAPARRRTVVTEYYAHLQNGGRRGPFETVDAAREAYPRVRRIDRRNIMSDGQSNWSTVRG